MLVSDVSEFKFVGKVNPAFFIANEEVLATSSPSEKITIRFDFADELKIGGLRYICTT